jgi:hypothetical protein
MAPYQNMLDVKPLGAKFSTARYWIGFQDGEI